MKISAEMYKLLIERTLDGFSVIELRDEFIVIKDSLIDPDEAYKKLSANLTVYKERLA